MGEAGKITRVAAILLGAPLHTPLLMKEKALLLDRLIQSLSQK
jgi:3-dehydroquinate dehydratase